MELERHGYRPQTKEDRAIGAEQPLSEVDEYKRSDRRDRSRSAAIPGGNWKASVEAGGKKKSKATDDG
jgi:hypothetical protein